jgi:hypothetical protein
VNVVSVMKAKNSDWQLYLLWGHIKNANFILLKTRNKLICLFRGYEILFWLFFS